ncbi:M10 family metallopeptidase C-terminal domain-containing protein [Synechococcus sp. GreenBA-s]|nr:M10 family metallopeptidase C-terminal domain-containing protein [Synechococcus sp. GreenBA-s]
MATVTLITAAKFLGDDNTGSLEDLITSKSGSLTVEGTFSCTNDAGIPVLYWSLDGGLTRTAVPAGSVKFTGTSGSFSFTASFAAGDGSLSFWLEPKDGVGDESVGIFEYSITGTSAGTTTINSVSDNVEGGVVGVVSPDGLSNDSTLTLTGNAAAGSTVSVKSIDANNIEAKIGTVKADLNGVWTLTTEPLKDNEYSFVAIATDLSGNSSSSDSYRVVLDATPPETPSVLILRTGADPTSDKIAAPITSQSTIYLHGSADAGSSVTVFNGGTELETIKADSNGQWVFELKDLENGNAYNLRASSSDAAGNSSAISDAIAIAVITSPSDAPQIINVSDNSKAGVYVDEGSVPNGGVSNDQTLDLTGVAAAGMLVKIYDGDKKIGETFSDDSTGAWFWSAEAPPADATPVFLAEGIHSFSVTTTTASGVESAASDPWEVTIDLTSPKQPGTFTVNDDIGLNTGSLEQVSGTVTVTDDNNLTLSGSVEAGAKVYIYDNGSPTAIGVVEADESTGAWVFQTGVLDGGKHSFTVMASDKAGNESDLSAPFNLTVNTTTPAAPTISGVKNGGATLSTGTFNQASSVDLSGTATPDTTVVIYNGAQELAKVTAKDDGSWSYQATGLADGSTYVWTAKAENTAGTLSDASEAFTLTIDRTAPLLSTTTELLSNANGPLLKENSGAGQVIYTATAADIDGVSWSLAGVDADSFDVSQAGVITLKDNPNYDTFNPDGTPGATAKPSYNFTLVGTDSAGNRSEKALTLGIQNVDEVKPTFGDATVSVPTLNAGSGANQLVYDANASDLDGTGVLAYTLGGANADRFSIEPNTGKVYLIENPTPSADEVLKYTVTATDPTGNKTTTSELSLAIKYVDITAPDAPVISGVFNAAGTTDLGAVLNAAETKDGVVVKGTAEGGSTVTVNWGTSQSAPTKADATTGAWSVTFANSELPADSTNAPITAIATDAAGNKSGIQSFNVAIDRVIVQPSLSPVSPDGIINAAEALNLVLSGTTEKGSSLKLSWNNVTYTNNGSGPNNLISVDENGVWSLVVPSGQVPTGTGTSNLTLSAVDAAGNVSTALIQAIAYDRGAPTVTVTDNVAGTANRSTAGVAYTYTFSEAVTDLTADDFTVINGSVSSVSGSGSTYTVTVAPTMGIASGNISMTLKANAVQDAAGNGNAENVNALQAIDTLAPTGLILNPTIATDNVVNAAEKTAGFTIGGGVEAGSTVSVLWGNQTRAAVVSGSTWSLAYTNNQIPADGNQTITVTATDAAGNTSVVSDIIRVDTVAPTATVNSLSFLNDSGTSTTDFITNNPSQTISGVLSAGTATGDVVEVSLNNGTSWTTAANTIGSTAFSLAGVTLPGSNTLQVRVKDAAGNTGAVRSQAYVLDTTPANRTVTAAGITLSADSGFSTTDRLTNVASQTFSGTLNGNVLAGERVQFSLNNGATWGTATTITNRATFTFTGALAQGTNEVKVRHLDVAGNESTPYSTPVTLDNTAATVTSVNIPNVTSGNYKAGDLVDVTVTFSEAVRVTGTPRLGLLVGTNTRQATYLSGTDSTTLTFRYTIAAGDSDLDGISINAGSLTLNAGTITDPAGNAANIANAAVATNPNSKVDGSLPTLSSTEVVNGNVVLRFSEALAGSSVTPSFFSLSAGGAVTAASVSGNTVTLTPTTAITGAGVSVSYNDGSTPDLSTGTIQDQSGNDAAAFSNAAATTITATGPISLAATTTFTTAALSGSTPDAITGNASVNTLVGNSGNNVITGGGGGDTLTGQVGGDTFTYTANNNSLLASFDKITDFVIGTDSIDATRTSGALGASKGTVTALTAAGISAVLTNTTFSAATNAAWFTFGSGTAQRTFLALNDGTRGFSASTDAIIEMTGVSGNMAGLTVI